MRQDRPTIGTDAEFFLAEGAMLSGEHPYAVFNDLAFEETYHVIRSAEGLLGGTKDKPIWDKDLGWQEDNVMGEFNVIPADDEIELAGRIKRAIALMRQKAAELNNKIPLFVPAATLNEAALLTPQAQNIGCDPDFNVWKLSENPKRAAWALGNIRTAAAHVHIGAPKGVKLTETQQIMLGRACDVFIGLPLTAYLIKLPMFLIPYNKIRKQYYGSAGSVRFKPYGIEYRVIDNFWVVDENALKLVIQGAQRAWRYFDEINDLITMLGGSRLLQRIINDVDPAYAGVLYKTTKLHAR